VGDNVIPDITSSFIRLVVVAFQICKITQKSKKIKT